MKRKVSAAGESFLERGNGLDAPAGARPRPASTLEGCRLCRKGSSSPDPESGEQWTPFGKINLVPGGKRTQGGRKPSAVLSADVCLSMCLSTTLRVCVCAGIVSGLVLFWCIVLFSLLTYSPFLFFSDLPSAPFVFGSFSEQVKGLGGN